MKTKNIVSLITSLVLPYFLFSQSVGINESNPSVKAALELNSHSSGPQGFLLTRVSTSERLSMNASLTSNEKSLLVFDKDLNEFYWWDGTDWQNFSNSSTSSSNAEIIGENFSTPSLSMTFNASPLAITDITQSVTTNANTQIKLSGIIRVSGSGFTYSVVNNLGLVVVDVVLQRAEDASFVTGLTDLQTSRCTPYIKTADQLNTTGTNRVIQFGQPCTIPIEYFDKMLSQNVTYYYRVIVKSNIFGQTPTAGTINIQDRSLIITKINN